MEQRVSQSLRLVSVLVASVAAAFAQSGREPFDLASSTTEQIHARMLELDAEIVALRSSFGRHAQIEYLAREYRALSQWLGGDDPANAGRASSYQVAQPSAPGPQMLVNPSCSAAATTTNISGTTGVISVGETPSIYTCTVSGVGAFLWDVDLTTSIVHNGCDDIEMWLTSPAGTKVVISTDNGGTNDNVFNGTLWNDNISATSSDFGYVNNVVATPLNPEGRFAAFRGENPNGVWKLTVADDLPTNTGSVTGWSLAVTTATAPVTSTSTFSDSPNIPISSGASGSYPDSQTVSGVGSILTGLKLYTEVSHSFCGHLDMTLVPPAGPTIKVSTDNAGSNSNCFDGTTFDPDSINAVTDFDYADGVAPLLSPEGSFDNWLGINPNGTWTLNVNDDTFASGGTFKRWDLIVTTTNSAVVPSSPSSFNGTTGAFVDAGPGGPSSVSFTAFAAGLGTYLWDVDLNAMITHAECNDLDMRLTSPAGTTVTVSTDNGDEDSFNGTLFDDNASAAITDAVYVAGSAVSPLSPEGRFAAFRGENPNGTWTLAIDDDTGVNGGNVNSWSLGLSTVPSAPVTSTTNYSRTPNITIPSTAPPLFFTDTIVASGLANSLTGLVLELEITHTYGSDIDITLTSPAGTVVPVTTGNGDTLDNIYGDGAGNGTRFDPDVTDPVTDHLFTNNVVASLLSPEGSFDAFNGQNPNGTWTLTVSDTVDLDGGVWHRWELDLKTCTASAVVTNCQIAPTATQTCDSVASSSGSPSASSASPFTITFAGMNAQVNSVAFYGLSGATTSPWGPQSILCVKAPTQRLTGVPGAAGSTGGTVGNCDGQLSFNFNAIIQGTGFLGTPMSAGQQVDIQGWQRDPASTKTTTLTDGLSFTVNP